MTEEGTDIGVETPPETPPSLNSFILDDGSLKEGWKETLLPENLRQEAIYDQIKDVKGAFSIIGNQAKLVGRKTTIPNENSTEGEWNAFYEAKGRPKTAEDYTLQVPEQFKEYYDEEQAKEAKQLFHKLGFSQKEANALWEFDQKRLEAGLQQAAQENALAESKAEEIIRQRSGADYDSDLQLTKRAVEKLTEGWTDEQITELIGEEVQGQDGSVSYYGGINDPKHAEIKPIIFSLLKEVGMKLVEHKTISDSDVPILTSQTKIDELTGKYLPVEDQKKLPYWDRGHPAHNEVVAQVQQLYKKLNPKAGQSA